MLAPQLLFVLILPAVCRFAPGFFIVRRFRWNPLEKLCGAVGLSLILLYLAAWTIYVLAPGSQRAAYFVVSAICAVLAAIAHRDLRSLLGIARVRRALAGFGFLLVWSGSILAMIRVYSGAGWIGDWLEHFQGSLFFLQRFPVNTSISGAYPLPARPPLMNVPGARLVEFPLGVLLQARVQNMEDRPGYAVYTGLGFVDGSFAIAIPGPESL